jgi:hypothetical protein
VPGYASLFAVTSIWHFLSHETDGLGDDVGLGPTVWINVVVVGTTSVVVNNEVTKMVETKVVAGSWVVTTVVDPGSVVTTVVPGNVKVDTIKLVTVLAGSCVVMVDVTPGSVMVVVTVTGGTTDVEVIV